MNFNKKNQHNQQKPEEQPKVNKGQNEGNDSYEKRENSNEKHENSYNKHENNKHENDTVRGKNEGHCKPCCCGVDKMCKDNNCKKNNKI